MSQTEKLIVFVDDDPDVLQLLRRGMRAVPRERRHCFENAREALNFVLGNREQVGVLVTDYRMPEMDGVELAKEVRLAAPEIPIICLSGFDLGQVNQDVFDHYYTKPPDFAVLSGAIETMLSNGSTGT